LKTQNFRADCAWFETENLYLQDMHDTLEEKNSDLLEQVIEANEAAGDAVFAIRQAKARIRSEFKDDNKLLADKLMLYSSIIEEVGNLMQETKAVIPDSLLKNLKLGGFLI
jgi:hypothetical protein